MDGMRLAFDATSLYGHRTGVGRFAEQVLQRLADHEEISTCVYATSWRERGHLRRITPRGVEVCGAPMPARPLRAMWRRLDLPPLELFTGPIDVSYGPNFLSPPTRHAAEMATVHDLTPLRFPELCTPDTLQYPTLIRRAARRGALFHTPTQAIADELVDALGVRPDRIAVVPLGLTPVGHGTIPQRLRDAIGSQFLLALGTIEPRKDLPTLVAAFDHLAAIHPDLRLVIAGPEGWGSTELTIAVAKCHANDRIIRTGVVDESTKSELLRAATMLVYPSVYEGFGLPPLEAMSVGTPVVTTEVPAITEVCGDGVSAVPIHDPEAVAKAVDSLLGDDELRRLQVERGRRAAARYDWDDTVDSLCRHMLELAGTN